MSNEAKHVNTFMNNKTPTNTNAHTQSETNDIHRKYIEHQQIEQEGMNRNVKKHSTNSEREEERVRK